MATKNDKKTLYTLLLLGGVGYLAYRKYMEQKKKEAEQAKLTENGDAYDESEYTLERGKSYISEQLFMNKDPEFMSHVRHLQQKLNNMIGKMDAKEFPFYPLDVDGLLGPKTALAIAYAFGKGKVPITSKQQVINLYTNFE